ncbi:hypothetical protein CFP65_1254 [Kitasatospora sp. MMS16-BH015]|uniref:hypothetical protein n=1 Tax=Kitasatospora sp. MMS16-BH015 TaxID=2018025 RepID=UPI000CA25DA1|nr:hypothetical protein [Kitasatospora sp. MMS16-BH015]AUG76156.1 hypothetical protein CFP65_1254 [Kitasatospora sp. MMS16-BH015]
MRTPRWTALALAAIPLLGGCAGAGALHDAGPARSLTPRPSQVPLWPAVQPAAAPSPEASGSLPPPSPVPGLTVPAGGLGAVEARTVLAADPALQPEERKALTGGCAGCQVQPAQLRDLSGDGEPELITAVLTGTDGGYLHVYQLREGRLFPVLAQRAQPGFSAGTVGPDLLLHEPDGPQSKTGTDTTYHWQDGRLVRTDRRITGSGLPDGATYCPAPMASVSVEPSVAPTAAPAAPSAAAAPATGHPEPLVSAVPVPQPRPTR